MSFDITLPWPPASLSGHAKGNWRAKAVITAKHRHWAHRATLAAGVAGIPATGDIPLVITFYPPDRRGDRTNYPNRIKPAIDGIAEALNVNDKRFLPTYHFAEPVRVARVVVSIGGAE